MIDGERLLGQALRQHGTLAEKPQGVPDARFALPSTINWMRALAILAVDQKVEFATARAFYSSVQARPMPEDQLNSVMEQLLFVLNQIAALQGMTLVRNKADVARTAIVAWYHGVYSAASAMTAAVDGSFQDNHTQTARKWQERFSAKRMALPPFADFLSSVLKKTAVTELAPVRAKGQLSLEKINSHRGCRLRRIRLPARHGVGRQRHRR
jgi:hypothetical protein